MSPQGRVSIPAPMRHELGLTPQTELVSYIEDGRVVIESRQHLADRIRRLAAAGRAQADTPDDGSVTDELIADRRVEFAAERVETEGDA